MYDASCMMSVDLCQGGYSSTRYLTVQLNSDGAVKIASMGEGVSDKDGQALITDRSERHCHLCIRIGITIL